MFTERCFYTCDVCGDEQDVSTSHLPRKWDEIAGKDVCDTCVREHCTCTDCGTLTDFEGLCNRCNKDADQDETKAEIHAIMRGELR